MSPLIVLLQFTPRCNVHQPAEILLDPLSILLADRKTGLPHD